MEYLRISDAVKDYGIKKIGPVSLSVGSSEIVGLLGPNGSGKSTTIRMSLGLIKPSSGTVSLMGYDPVKEHKKALMKVGYSPELPNLQTFLTPNEFLELICREYGISNGKDEKIKEVLELVGLINYEHVKIGKLSKGMVQRLTIAQALISDPDFLILDEPMIGIDPAGVSHFRKMIRSIAKGGKKAVLFSSHILSEVEQLCDKVVVIHSGRIVYSGSVGEFVSENVGSRLLRVELTSYPEHILNEIRNIDGVLNVRSVDGMLEVEVRNGKEVRPEISRLVVSNNVGLLSIYYSRNEIEEAYRNAIRRNK